MTTRGPNLEEIMHGRFLNAMTNAAIELAKLAATKDPAPVDEAWAVVREAFVKQMPTNEQKGSRQDLDELYSNTKLHAAQRAVRQSIRVTKQV